MPITCFENRRRSAVPPSAITRPLTSDTVCGQLTVVWRRGNTTTTGGLRHRRRNSHARLLVVVLEARLADGDDAKASALRSPRGDRRSRARRSRARASRRRGFGTSASSRTAPMTDGSPSRRDGRRGRGRAISRVQAGRSATSPTVSDALTRSNAKRANGSCSSSAHTRTSSDGALRNIAIEKSTPTTRAAPVRAGSGRYRPEPVPTSSALLGPSVRRID